MTSNLKKLFSKRITWGMLAFVILAGAGGFTYFRMFYENPVEQTDGGELQTATVRRGDLVVYASGSGTLTAASKASFGFGTSGQIKEIDVSVGEVVEAGQLLAELDDIITQISLLLVKRHDVTLDTADFTVTTQQDIISTQESTTAAFRSLLAWVAGVSLIVGGIGIMNIMLVSVTERTREIGIRQSIGATPNDIRLQFLSEALLLSIIGGLMGIAIGVGGSYIFSTLSDMRTVVQAGSILLAFGSAAIIGAFFGYYPANQAAQLDPIEALRYE